MSTRLKDYISDEYLSFIGDIYRFMKLKVALLSVLAAPLPV